MWSIIESSEHQAPKKKTIVCVREQVLSIVNLKLKQKAKCNLVQFCFVVETIVCLCASRLSVISIGAFYGLRVRSDRS